MRSGRAGVSLLELLVVLSLIGVATGMASTAIDLAEMRTGGAARAVAGRLAAAQRLAVLRQHDVRVLVDTAAAEVRTHEDADNDGQVTGGERVTTQVLEAGVGFGRLSSPALPFGAESVSFEAEGGIPVVVFHRNGSASEWGGLYLSARLRGDAAEWALELDRATGRVSMLRFAAAGWEAAW